MATRGAALHGVCRLKCVNVYDQLVSSCFTGSSFLVVAIVDYHTDSYFFGFVKLIK